MEQIILPLKNFFGEMGLYNSIVAVLYWKQLSWDSSPLLSLIFSHSPLPPQSSSFTHSLDLYHFPSRSSSFFHFPSSLLSLLISSKTSQISNSCPAQVECMCACISGSAFAPTKWDFAPLTSAVAGCVYHYSDPVVQETTIMLS